MIVTNFLDVCVEQGRAFEISGELTITAGGTIKLLGRSGEGRTHLANFFVRSEQGPLSIKILEGVTVTDAGTPVSAINRNRNSTTTPNTTPYALPTTSGGDIIYQSAVHEVGGGAHIQGGESEMPGMIILKDNTDYTFEITNNNAADTQISYSILWWEEE